MQRECLRMRSSLLSTADYCRRAKRIDISFRRVRFITSCWRRRLPIHRKRRKCYGADSRCTVNLRHGQSLLCTRQQPCLSEKAGSEQRLSPLPHQLLEDDEKHMREFRHMKGSPPVRDVTAFEISERLAGPFQLHQRGTDSGSSVPRLSAHAWTT